MDKNFKKNYFFKKKNNDLYIRIYLFIFNFIKDALRNIVLLIKNKLYLKKFFFHKNEPMNIVEISNYVAKLCKCLNIKNTFKITKLSDDIIKINSNNG